jgi:hypothetical protein
VWLTPEPNLTDLVGVSRCCYAGSLPSSGCPTAVGLSPLDTKFEGNQKEDGLG